jgi:hypothetical protein
MTNIFDNVSSAKTFPLASTILAAARDGTMGTEEIQHTITNLTELLHAKASEDHVEKKRIARMNATSVDPKFRPIVMRVDAELKRLGFEGGANEFAEKGTLKKLNEAMSAAAMHTDKRWQLKENMSVLGLIG